MSVDVVVCENLIGCCACGTLYLWGSHLKGSFLNGAHPTAQSISTYTAIDSVCVCVCVCV